MSDNDRVAYLTGDTRARLDATERAELDELRLVLTEPAVWVEPDPALQERIVDAITAAAVAPLRPAADDLARRRRSRRIRYTIIGAAAAAALAFAGIALGTAGHHSRPTEFAASLTGTELAPGASGQVTLTQTAGGWKIRLRATGLPRLDNGTYYEAWLKDAAGKLVAIGTFNEPNDVTLWAGVAPSNFPTLTITRQRADGNAASSGQRVLVGTTHRTH